MRSIDQGRCGRSAQTPRRAMGSYVSRSVEDTHCTCAHLDPEDYERGFMFVFSGSLAANAAAAWLSRPSPQNFIFVLHVLCVVAVKGVTRVGDVVCFVGYAGVWYRM